MVFVIFLCPVYDYQIAPGVLYCDNNNTWLVNKDNNYEKDNQDEMLFPRLMKIQVLTLLVMGLLTIVIGWGGVGPKSLIHPVTTKGFRFLLDIILDRQQNSA